MNENLLPIFIALTGAAVVLQAGLLAAMYLAMRKTSTRLESLAEEIKTKALPALDSTQSLLTEIRPKLQTISDNLVEVTTKVRSQVQRADATVHDALDRARLQVIRTDEMVTRTLDKVEATSEIVQKTVVSPVRQVSGVFQGISAGVEFFLHGRAGKNGGNRDSRRPVPQDEMFI
jgi:signal transduction histidine kinase